MTSVIPSASACYSLQLPPTDKDDRLNLNVRTGSASTLYNSLVMTFAGMTIGLELHTLSISELVEVFVQKLGALKAKRLERYLSAELFVLNILERVWQRVETPPETARPQARLFHEVTACNNCLYLFGGLALAEGADDSRPVTWLTPVNDLWEFNLEHNTWRLLDDGTASDSDTGPQKPCPRYSHKLTPLASLSFLDKPDHHGILIAGGRDANSELVYENYIFDLVDGSYTGTSIGLAIAPTLYSDSLNDIDDIANVDDNFKINIEYSKNIVVAFDHENNHTHRHEREQEKKRTSKISLAQESIIVYAPTKVKRGHSSPNPLLSFKLGRHIRPGTILPLHRRATSLNLSSGSNHIIPYNLRYPTAGVFGKNVVICGFLPNDYNISIFVYNKPTGKWLRLNVFCHHDYGSHRFWGGFVWRSHHKVVLLGNYLTSRTTSSIRFFTQMVLVSLPITNILASSELAGGHVHGPHGKRVPISDDSSEQSTSTSASETEGPQEDSDSDLREHSNAISFSEYVLYAAPKTKFTNISSVLPAAAVTLGRNAFDRYGDLISDFELVSASGDRIPALIATLKERWGGYFLDLLSRGYVQAVAKFEKDQREHPNARRTLRSSQASEVSSSAMGSSIHSDTASDTLPKTFHVLVVNPSAKDAAKDTPQFRLPFQELSLSSELGTSEDHIKSQPDRPATERPTLVSNQSAVDPHQASEPRRNSSSSFQSQNSLLLSQLLEIPPQLPLPNEPIPGVPVGLSFRSQSRRGSSDYNSPRASLIHTLTTLRNIPVKSPRNSPFASPRASLSGPSGLLSSLNNVTEPTAAAHYVEAAPVLPTDSSLPESPTHSSTPNENANAESELERGLLNRILLDFEDIDDNYAMEPSLIPRKLYIPFPTATLRAFSEYLYTGQIGNKWPLQPTTLNILAIARFFKLPLLYDLICEVLFGIIGRKEAYIVREVNKLRQKHDSLLALTHSEPDHNFVSPLEEYEGLMDTVDDGYFDMNLLQKTSNVHKRSLTSRFRSWDSSALNPQAVDETVVMADAKQEQADTTQTSAESNSDFKTPSNSEDEDYDFDIAYLNEPAPNVPVGPRSKSIFDKMDIPFQRNHNMADDADDVDDNDEKDYDHMSLTLDELVSPDSPVPSDHVLELIHEVGALTTDMKLMLRSANARHMNMLLKQTQDHMNERIAALEKKLEEQQAQVESELDVGDSESEVTSHRPSELKTSQSATSLHTMNSLRISSTDKPSTAFRTIGGLTPFRMTKSDSKKSSIDENKEVDKRINRLVKQDQKLKKQQIDRDRAKPATLSERSSSRTDLDLRSGNKPRLPSRAQTSSSIPYSDSHSVSSVDTTKKKKHHGIFHHLSSHKLSKKPSSVKAMSPSESTPPTDGSELLRSLLALSLELGTSRKSDKKKGFGLFKKMDSKTA